jgi:hypothetical protein
MIRFVFAIVAGLALTACARTAATDEPIAEQWRRLTMTAETVDFGAEQVGRLRYRGGVELITHEAGFGGISDLEVFEDGRVVAINDNGAWLEWRLVLDDAGTLVDVDDFRMAFMRDETGEPFADKDDGDSEDMAQLPDGRFAISFEQTQSIRLYDLNRDGPFGAASPGPVLDDVRDLPDNSGLEALAAMDDGSLIVGAEGGERATTPLWRVRLDAQTPTAPSARYATAPGFSLTALDRLPDGGFVALERFYTPVIGARARITRFAAFVEGDVAVEELAMIEAPRPVDNFEGIAATRAPDGSTRLYIVSDDNFNARQRTLLLAFDIVQSP